MDVKVNNEVIIVDRRRGLEERGVVTKVARKYFTVKIDDWTEEFAIDSGKQRAESNYSSNYSRYAYTLQAYTDKHTRDVALARFRAFGLEFDYRGTYTERPYTERTISTTKLLAINEILEASDDG
jgi:hypothetical protein